jgi:hypothetical protein
MTSNACELWMALATPETPPAPAMLNDRYAVIVWRQNMVSHFRLIDAREERALMLARGGLSFADLCVAIVASLGEDEGIPLAGAYLGQWLAGGIIDAATGK